VVGGFGVGGGGGGGGGGGLYLLCLAGDYTCVCVGEHVCWVLLNISLVLGYNDCTNTSNPHAYVTTTVIPIPRHKECRHTHTHIHEQRA